MNHYTNWFKTIKAEGREILCMKSIYANEEGHALIFFIPTNGRLKSFGINTISIEELDRIFDNTDFDFFYHNLQERFGVNTIDNISEEKERGKNLIPQMTTLFQQWADNYFQDGEKLNKEIPKDRVYEDFLRETKAVQRYWTPHRFSKALQAWCKFNGYTYNDPEDCYNNSIDIDDRRSIPAEFIMIAAK